MWNMRIWNRLSFSDWPPKINTSKTRAAGLVSWPCLCFVSAHNKFQSAVYTNFHALLPSSCCSATSIFKNKTEKSAALKVASPHLPPDWRHRSSLPGRLCPADSCLFKKDPKNTEKVKNQELKHKWWRKTTLFHMSDHSRPKTAHL